MNWRPKLKKLEKSLNLWKSRYLSLPGKAFIINMLGLSKLVYLARVLTLPAWVTVRVNALIWPFLWGSKMERVSRKTFLKPKDGGINVINLPLKAQALTLAGMASVLNSPEDSSFFMPILLVAVYVVCAHGLNGCAHGANGCAHGANDFLCIIIRLLALSSRLLFTRHVWIPYQGWLTAL